MILLTLPQQLYLAPGDSQVPLSTGKAVSGLS
jgi:hypothetical protein